MDNTTDIPRRKCTKCGEEYPVTPEYWHRNKEREDGLHTRCKSCMSAYQRNRTQRTPIDLVAVPKQCSKCGKTYPRSAEYWFKRADSPDGFRGVCKGCDKNRFKRYREDNRERVCAANREYYKRHLLKEQARSRAYGEKNREKRRERARIRYRANAEEMRLRATLYRKSNSDAARKRQQAYCKAHPDRVRESQKAARYARRTQAEQCVNKLTPSDIRAQYNSQSGKCWYCLKPVGDKYHIDHVIPLSRGGKHEARNIVVACPTCNMSKGAKTPSEWIGKLF